MHSLTFSVNNWEHRYSLQQAITHNQQFTGNKLSISGTLRQQAFLNNLETEIELRFLNTENTPDYPVNDSGEYILSELNTINNKLFAEIKVDNRVFEELRKNLMEYGDIEGIHIMVILGIDYNKTQWQNPDPLPLIQLDYAMKGDA